MADTATKNSELTLPHDADAERCVLSAMMRDAAACLECRRDLTAGDFYVQPHGAVFEALTEPMDAYALGDKLGRKHPYLLDLAGFYAANWRSHVEIVRRHGESRRVIGAGVDVTALGREGGSAADALAVVSGIVRRKRSSRKFAAAFEQRVEEYGRPTPFFTLPGTGVRLHYGDLTILAGRPGTGKSAYGMVTVWQRSAVEPAAVFTYEMTESQMVDRLVQHVTGISNEMCYEGLSASERDLYRAAVAGAGERDLTIHECAGMREDQLRSELQLFAAAGGKTAFVDYLQIARTQTREGEVADLTRLSAMLRETAKTTGLNVVAASQFRRFEGADSETRCVFPTMADLRGTGAFEQDAANVCLMYSMPDSKAGRELRSKLWAKYDFAEDMSDSRTLLRLHFPKVRYAAGGRKYYMFFDEAAMRFVDLDRLA